MTPVGLSPLPMIITMLKGTATSVRCSWTVSTTWLTCWRRVLLLRSSSTYRRLSTWRISSQSSSALRMETGSLVCNFMFVCKEICVCNHNMYLDSYKNMVPFEISPNDKRELFKSNHGLEFENCKPTRICFAFQCILVYYSKQLQSTAGFGC